MATEKEHEIQAEHNQKFLDSIDKAQFPDWVATAAFYKAVHLVEVLLARKGKSKLSGSHVKRNQFLKKDYPAIWKSYRPLYCFSRQVRYRCIKVKPSDIACVLKYLEKVEKTIIGLL